ncbi:MAG: hypothetical protein M3423_07405, partial [Actinomycetota bacterium]|nr:hypothetical protein [Actinomycetota bacterium]
MPLRLDQLGQRVVVRRLLSGERGPPGGPAMSDVLGILETWDDVELSLDVPSRLLDGMRDGRFDVALLPVIDYQRMRGLRLIP